jgi:rRNA maturation RNase YbeY
VLLTTDAALRKLNRNFRGKDQATDVLSFPQFQGIGAEEIAGDLAISVPTALRQAVEQGHSLSTEIKILILHGLLHLAGYDHEADNGKMARRERLLRARLNLPQGLIERAEDPFPKNRRSRSTLRFVLPNSAFRAPGPHFGTWETANPNPQTGPKAMTLPFLLLILFLAAVETLASYISRVYAEFGKILTREIEENSTPGRSWSSRNSASPASTPASAPRVLQQLALGIIALEFGAVLFDRAPHLRPPHPAEIAQAVLAVVLVVVFCNQLFPRCSSTAPGPLGAQAHLAHPPALLWLMTPITVFIRFFFSVASLAEEPVTP